MPLMSTEKNTGGEERPYVCGKRLDCSGQTTLDCDVLRLFICDVGVQDRNNALKMQ